METGKLYMVATPIGNLDDITFRAVKILQETVDLIICEDTRQTGKILKHLNIRKQTRSLHSHTGSKKIEDLCSQIREGTVAAYLTDSGTPGVSDPGSRLVNTARSMGIEVIPVPGPSALASIISVSGFPEKRIIFMGFPGKKKGKLRKELENLKGFRGIIVLYESPYRIIKLLEVVAEIFPENRVIIGREMTKLYEEFYTGKAAELWEKRENIREKGELTLAILNDNGENNT